MCGGSARLIATMPQRRTACAHLLSPPGSPQTLPRWGGGDKKGLWLDTDPLCCPDRKLSGRIFRIPCATARFRNRHCVTASNWCCMYLGSPGPFLCVCVPATSPLLRDFNLPSNRLLMYLVHRKVKDEPSAPPSSCSRAHGEGKKGKKKTVNNSEPPHLLWHLKLHCGLHRLLFLCLNWQNKQTLLTLFICGGPCHLDLIFLLRTACFFSFFSKTLLNPTFGALADGCRLSLSL